ncbi:MAG: NUDIX domain-containing protein [Rhodospirillales bacterium]
MSEFPVGGDFGFDDVAVESRETAYTGYFRIDRYRLRHRLFAGGWSGPMGREVFERGQAVAVLLYDPDADALILIEQFRAGVYAAGSGGEIGGVASPWLIEIIAGIIGEGEASEEVARREAMEEAGCEVGDLVRVCRIFASPGASSETVEIFFATCKAPAAGALHGLDHENEDIRVLVVPPEVAFSWIEEGRIVNGPSIVGLQWFQINGARFRPASLPR